tara:strand:- start:294 stop:977 length:684 start_codon:yes stop_codon:yes gene_type:complete
MPGFSKILPLLIIVIFISFSVRLSDFFLGMKNISSTAYAENKAEDTHAADDAPALGHGEDSAKDDGHVKEVSGHAADAPKWRDASDTNLDVSDVKMEMFEDLAARRKQLEESEQKMQVKEALLKATEQEIDRKYQELTKLKQEIEGLLDQQSDQEQGRIESLVKIYEGMKPKDAARIFDTLDIDVLVSVVSKMSERKVAPVLAAMNAERARKVTIMLAEQKTLPVLQ